MPYIVSQFLLSDNCCTSGKSKSVQRNGVSYHATRKELIDHLAQLLDSNKFDTERLDTWFDQIIESGVIRNDDFCMCGEVTYIDDDEGDFEDREIWTRLATDLSLNDIKTDMMKTGSQYICRLISLTDEEIGVLYEGQLRQYIKDKSEEHQVKSRSFSRLKVKDIIQGGGVRFTSLKQGGTVNILIDRMQVHKMQGVRYLPQLEDLL